MKCAYYYKELETVELFDIRLDSKDIETPSVTICHLSILNRYSYSTLKYMFVHAITG